eukprot:2578902-Rhodomonas_salina.2
MASSGQSYPGGVICQRTDQLVLFFGFYNSKMPAPFSTMLLSGFPREQLVVENSKAFSSSSDVAIKRTYQLKHESTEPNYTQTNANKS